MYHPFLLGRVSAVALGCLLSSAVGFGTMSAQTGSSPSAPDQADTAYFRSNHFAPRDTVSATVYQGWKQFELNCARCHGDFGVGTSFAPALVESVKPTGTIPTPELFLQTVCSGRPDKGMPAWCTLGLEIGTIQQIYSYLSDRASGKVGIGRPAELAE